MSRRGSGWGLRLVAAAFGTLGAVSCILVSKPVIVGWQVPTFGPVAARLSDVRHLAPSSQLVIPQFYYLALGAAAAAVLGVLFLPLSPKLAGGLLLLGGAAVGASALDFFIGMPALVIAGMLALASSQKRMSGETASDPFWDPPDEESTPGPTESTRSPS